MKDTRKKLLSLEAFFRNNNYSFFAYLGELEASHQETPYTQMAMEGDYINISDQLRFHMASTKARNFFDEVILSSAMTNQESSRTWTKLKKHWIVYLDLHQEYNAVWENTKLNEVEILNIDSILVLKDYTRDNIEGFSAFDKDLI